MSPLLIWILATLAVALGLLTSILSALLERSGLIRLRHWAGEAGGPLETLYQRKRRFEIYRLLLSLIARLSVVAVYMAARALGAPIWGAVAAAGLIILVSELASRLTAARSAEVALRRLTPAYRAGMVVLGPLIALLRALLPTPVPQDAAEPPEIEEASEGEIDAYISVGQREGILEPGEEVLVKGVVEFGDTLVKSVMTPRIDMVAAPLASEPEELLEILLDSGHSRLPLYRESADQIVAVLHLRDLVTALRSGEPVDLEAIARPAYVVPETKQIAVLLREFQARHQQLAIVVDEFGGTAGVATVEDLLEEIVGDIADEHEEHDPERVQLGDEIWLMAGSSDIEELEELFGLDLGDPPYETVGGLVFTALGYLPERGEKVRRHGLVFEVLDIEDRRIRSLRVRREGGEPA